MLKQKEINALLRNRINGIEASIGMQYCLSDGANIYIGVKTETESSNKFRAFVSMGVFEPEYEALIEQIRPGARSWRINSDHFIAGSKIRRRLMETVIRFFSSAWISDSPRAL